MAVASLALQLSDYRTAAIADIGYGSTAYASLEAAEAAEIDRLILRAERTFWLHPPVGFPHVWSCLRDPGLLDLWGDIAVTTGVTVTQSTTTMTANTATFYETMVGKSVIVTSEGTFTITGYTSSTVVTVTPSDTYATPRTFSIASDASYRLPSDFDTPDSSTLTFTESEVMPSIQLINEKELIAMRSVSQTGYPRYGSIRWVASDGTAGQSQELLTWPEADAHYEVAMPFIAQPQGMTTANPYPRGGPEMADALLYMLFAVCEEAKNGQRGDRWAAAQDVVTAAAIRDRARHHNFIAGRMLPDAGAMRVPLDVKSRILPA